MRLFAVLCAVAFCPFAAFAQDYDHAKETMARELTQCAGFYLALAVRDGAPTQPTEASDAFMERGQKALVIAKKYVSDEKRLRDLGGRATELFLIESVKNGWENLNREFAGPCNELMTNPEKRFEELQAE